MHLLGARDIVQLTEKGAGAGSANRALLLLQAAFPDAGGDALESASLSMRDRALLEVRESLFGSRIQAREVCAHCDEVLEFEFTAADVGLAPKAERFPPPPSACLLDRTSVRAISALDAVYAEGAETVDAARTRLAERVAPGASDSVELDNVLEALDPLANVEVTIDCPTCESSSSLDFDAATFVWREIAARVAHVLNDVADLAASFHWSEQDILALPASRRAFYLAKVRE